MCLLHKLLHSSIMQHSLLEREKHGPFDTHVQSVETTRVARQRADKRRCRFATPLTASFAAENREPACSTTSVSYRILRSDPVTGPSASHDAWSRIVVALSLCANCRDEGEDRLVHT